MLATFYLIFICCLALFMFVAMCLDARKKYVEWQSRKDDLYAASRQSKLVAKFGRKEAKARRKVKKYEYDAEFFGGKRKQHEKSRDQYIEFAKRG